MNPYNQQLPLFPRPPQSQDNNQPPFFATTPPPPNYQTQSWLELNLLGQALSFQLTIGTQEITVVLQDPIYLSQVVTEAPGMTVENQIHYQWMSNTPNHFFFPTNNYPAWEIPPYISPLIYQLNNEISFFSTATLNPQMRTPLVTPWTLPYQNQNYPSHPFMATPINPPPYFQSFHFQNQALTLQAPPPPPPPSTPLPSPPQEQDQVVSDLPNSVELAAILQNHRETRTEMYILRELRVLIFQERYEKKVIILGPINLVQANIDIYTPRNPVVGNFAVILTPFLNTRGQMANPLQQEEMIHALPNQLRQIKLIIWNCRGSNRPDFRRNFHALIDWHRPSVVALLETKMEDHQPILDDFLFTHMIQVPAQGLSRGMVVLWDANVLELTQVEVTNHAIHAKVQVMPNRNS
ncbi:hypothetical protein HAX54_036463 [Datura stramonium]|uniref:Uncharacterized protein n=1 Tax=Datura stramonium TaxID=4076 RepID=A0ABS8VI60_DATST|nr:hypothetical protein [Datura stramonium]